MASPTSSPWQAQQTTEEANPQILKKKKKPNTEQISTLETSNQYIRNH